ncbi:MAG TPA: DUF924 family protein [Casimicrobiaceae bacterium]|jgi:uncharacterized protein (DUF924 family)|nr:DUF924 family protein [Casimicrobiaceae bacterium]
MDISVPQSPPLAALAREILAFWFGPTPHVARDTWFRKDDAFDREIRERFGAALAAGIAGAFGEWCTTAHGSLARVVLLDQLTRNAFRGTADQFAGDPGALATANDALERGFDRALDAHERSFLYMPFEHSERLDMQDRAVELFTALAAETGVDAPLPWAHKHRDIIRRFGRFPHRNAMLGRESTAEELAFLEQPGSRF